MLINLLMLMQIVIYLQLLKLFNFSSVWEHVYIKHDKPFSHYYIIPVIILWHSQITFFKSELLHRPYIHFDYFYSEIYISYFHKYERLSHLRRMCLGVCTLYLGVWMCNLEMFMCYTGLRCWYFGACIRGEYISKNFYFCTTPKNGSAQESCYAW